MFMMDDMISNIIFIHQPMIYRLHLHFLNDRYVGVILLDRIYIFRGTNWDAGTSCMFNAVMKGVDGPVLLPIASSAERNR